MTSFTYIILEVEGPASLHQTMRLWRGGRGKSQPHGGAKVYWECEACYSYATKDGMYRYIADECERHRILIDAAIHWEMHHPRPEPTPKKRKAKPTKSAQPADPKPQQAAPPTQASTLKPKGRTRKKAGGITVWED